MTPAQDLATLNPYPGLRPFGLAEADRFFGRADQIGELADRLQWSAFMAVVGSSGCGKSSLVCAGLLAELARRSTPSGTEWRPIVMRPGSQPIENLARQLSPLLGGSSTSEESRVGALGGRLRLGGLGLVEAVRQGRLAPAARVLLVVDQFEELFRYRGQGDPEDASAFVKLLLHAAHDPGSPVSVVLTMRSDRIGDCANFRSLAESVSRGQYLVPKLTLQQRREAIKRPAELRGAVVAPRLVQRILNDVSDSFDDLAVMQHALTRTWDRWARDCLGARPIDIADYEAVGGAAEALSRHAEEALGSLVGLGRVAERVFRALTERGPGGADTRRPLRLSLLAEIADAERVQVEQVVERFRRPDTAFLTPPAEVPLADETVVDLSHEALIRLWGRLQAWSRDEGEAREQLVAVAAAAHRYQTGSGSQWNGPDLRRALEWRAAVRPSGAWVELYLPESGAQVLGRIGAFLHASDEAERRARFRHRVSTVLRVAMMVAVGVLAVAVLAMVALRQRAKSRELTSRALLELDQDPARAAHFALAATLQDPEDRRAAYALRQSLATLESAFLERSVDLGAPAADARYSGDGKRLVVAAGARVLVLDAGNLETLHQVVRPAPVSKALLLAGASRLVTLAAGVVQVQDLGDDSTLREFTCGPADKVYTLATSKDELLLALGCHDGGLRVVGVKPESTLEVRMPRPRGHPVTTTAVAFSADGEYLASGDADGVVRIWKAGSPEVWIGPEAGKEAKWPIRHDGAVMDISFQEENTQILLTAGADSKAALAFLDLKRRRLATDLAQPPARWELKHQRSVLAARFLHGREHDLQVVTVSGKLAILWSNIDRPEPRIVRGHDDWVIDASVASNGEVFVTASADGTARVWAVGTASPIAVLRGHRDEVVRAFFSPDDSRVVTASSDHTLRIWKYRRPQTLWSSTRRWALSAAFSPDGTRVAVGAEDGLDIVELNPLEPGASPRPSLLFPEKSGQISHLTWSRDGQVVLAMRSEYQSGRRGPLMWDTGGEGELNEAALESWSFAAFAARADAVAVAGEEGAAVFGASVQNAPPSGGEPLRLGGKALRWSVAISDDGRWIATDGEDGLLLWERTSPQAPARKLVGHEGQVVDMRFSGDGRALVTAGRDRAARIWPVEGAGPPKVLTGCHTSSLGSAAFDSSGKLVATGGADGSICLWDAAKAELLGRVRWHAEGVNDVAFSSDGEWILSASDDGTVKLGQCQACLLSLRQLQEKVPELANMPPGELKAVKAETRVRMDWLRLPTLER